MGRQSIREAPIKALPEKDQTIISKAETLLNELALLFADHDKSSGIS
jgi:hypothetical protein